MVERAWAPLSWRLVGVTLPITLPGEDTPLCQQTDLSPEALQQGSHDVRQGHGGAEYVLEPDNIRWAQCVLQQHPLRG